MTEQAIWHRGATAREHLATVAQTYTQLPDSVEVCLPLGVVRAALACQWDARDPAAVEPPAEPSTASYGGLAAGTVASCAVCQARITWVPYDAAGREWNGGDYGRWVDDGGTGLGNPLGVEIHRHHPAAVQ